MNDTHHISRLTPVAAPHDPAWQGRRIWSRVDVVAHSAGEAILAAVRYEQKMTGSTDLASQDHQQGRSGFEDERLYRVDRQANPVPSNAQAGDVLFAD